MRNLVHIEVLSRWGYWWVIVPSILPPTCDDVHVALSCNSTTHGCFKYDPQMTMTRTSNSLQKSKSDADSVNLLLHFKSQSQDADSSSREVVDGTGTRWVYGHCVLSCNFTTHSWLLYDLKMITTKATSSLQKSESDARESPPVLMLVSLSLRKLSCFPSHDACFCGFHPHIAALNSAVSLVARHGGRRFAQAFVDVAFAALGCDANVVIFNSIVDGYCRVGDLRGASASLSSMHSYGPIPTLSPTTP
ncbi:hypothetical protein GW17_00025172 [Ensete ventricosum]|nr:hypothetical protein GW17_00025172 [Ensete ventricosum]